MVLIAGKIFVWKNMFLAWKIKKVKKLWRSLSIIKLKSGKYSKLISPDLP